MTNKENCLSIITNFGCHYTCPYCVVKENNLHIPRTTLEGLNSLKQSVIDNDINMISISGGGDPVHNYIHHKDWYEKFFNIINNLRVGLNHKVRIELHTSYINYKNFPYERFDRIVYHVIIPEKIMEIQDPLYYQNVRVVFVVTKDFNIGKIRKIVSIVKDTGIAIELTFRQMIDSNYNATTYLCDFLKQGHKKEWWYIEQNDYNLYYAENKISYKYEDFKNQ